MCSCVVYEDSLPVPATIGAVTRMRAWVELSRYRIWLMILGEKSVADLGCGWSGDK